MEYSLTVQIMAAVMVFVGIGLSIGKYQHHQDLRDKKEDDANI